MLELIKELDSMTPAAPFPCRTEKEIATIGRINQIWHMLHDKIYEAMKSMDPLNEEYQEVITKHYMPVVKAWDRFITAQKRLARKQDDLIAYPAVILLFAMPHWPT